MNKKRKFVLIVLITIIGAVASQTYLKGHCFFNRPVRIEKRFLKDK